MKTISTLRIIFFMKAWAVAGASVFVMASGAGCATPYSPPPQAAKSQSANSTESSMAMREKRVLASTPIQKSKPVTTQLTEAPAPKASAPIAQAVEQPAAASAAPSAEPVAVVAEQPAQQVEVAPENGQAPAAVVAEQPAQQSEAAPENAQVPVAVVAEQPAQQVEAAPENAQAPSAVVVEQSAQQPEAAPVIAPEPIQPATTTPVSRESGASARQNLVLERANTSHAQVVLIGDSITEGWEGARDQLQSLVGLRSAANLGVGGDRTQHVLWRLQQAPLMSVNPKVIVLMIGTNNIYDDSADDIVSGIRAITALMNQQCPNAESLVLDIPPRGDPMDSARAKIAQINAELAQGEWPGHARFVRVGNQFLGADGALDRADLPDLLHFSQKGYAMWAAAIKPELDASLAANHSQPAPTTPHP
jgi:lysophospholipase L1-like esterase